MKRPVVFVCGPFRAGPHGTVKQHVKRAEEAALEIWKMGAVVLCPHLNTANFDGLLPDERFLEGAIELMARSDSVYMLQNLEFSIGAKRERAIAQERGMRIFGDYELLRKWINEKLAALNPRPGHGSIPSKGERQGYDPFESLESRPCPLP